MRRTPKQLILNAGLHEELVDAILAALRTEYALVPLEFTEKQAQISLDKPSHGCCDHGSHSDKDKPNSQTDRTVESH